MTPGRNLAFVHYWKTQIPNQELESWSDKTMKGNTKIWLIFLEEKLRRIESEIFIR